MVTIYVPPNLITGRFLEEMEDLKKNMRLCAYDDESRIAVYLTSTPEEDPAFEVEVNGSGLHTEECESLMDITVCYTKILREFLGEEFDDDEEDPCNAELDVDDCLDDESRQRLEDLHNAMSALLEVYLEEDPEGILSYENIDDIVDMFAYNLADQYGLSTRIPTSLKDGSIDEFPYDEVAGVVFQDV